MNDTLILILAIGIIAFLLTIIDSRWRLARKMRSLEAANWRRVKEIAALDKKLEQYIATDERVMELWPADEMK